MKSIVTDLDAIFRVVPFGGHAFQMRSDFYDENQNSQRFMRKGGRA